MEISRRVRVSELRYAVRLEVNGQTLAQSAPCPVDGAHMQCTLAALDDVPITVRLVRWPQSVCLKVDRLSRLQPAIPKCYFARLGARE